jgi:hypothetical protein
MRRAHVTEVLVDRLIVRVKAIHLLHICATFRLRLHPQRVREYGRLGASQTANKSRVTAAAVR